MLTTRIYKIHPAPAMEPFRENAFINVLNNCNAEAIKDTKSTGVKKRTRENRKKKPCRNMFKGYRKERIGLIV